MISFGGTAKVTLLQKKVVDFLFHRSSVEYQEPQINQALGSSYLFTLPARDPSVRIFTVFFETMQYFLNQDGALDLEAEPGINMAWLEALYNLHRLAIPFWYKHPVFGLVKVRFMEPLQVPPGRPRGGGLLEAFSIRLVEDPQNPIMYNVDNVNFGADDFGFDNHLYSHKYLPQGKSIPLGGGYTYALRGWAEEQRVFTLRFQTMLFYLDELSRVDILTDTKNNAGLLQAFYNQMKLDRVFNYNHPVLGKIPVRFNQSLKLPDGIPKGQGCLPPFEIELIEVIS